MPIWKTLSDRKSKEHYFQFKQKNGFSLTRPEQVLLKAGATSLAYGSAEPP